MFNAAEVAKVFYGRPKLWLYRQLPLVVGQLEVSHNVRDFWRFQLRDVEVLNRSLFSGSIITLNQFERTLIIVKAMAENYRLI